MRVTCPQGTGDMVDQKKKRGPATARRALDKVPPSFVYACSSSPWGWAPACVGVPPRRSTGSSRSAGHPFPRTQGTACPAPFGRSKPTHTYTLPTQHYHGAVCHPIFSRRARDHLSSSASSRLAQGSKALLRPSPDCTRDKPGRLERSELVANEARSGKGTARHAVRPPNTRRTRLTVMSAPRFVFLVKRLLFNIVACGQSV